MIVFGKLLSQCKLFETFAVKKMRADGYNNHELTD